MLFKPWTKKEKWAPFDKQGGLLHYPGENVEWREVSEPIALTLSYVTFDRGRSAAWTIWEDSNGRRFPMSLGSLDVLLHNVGRTKNVAGRWAVKKQGQNYSVEYVGE